MPSMFVPETQGVARDGSDDEMLIDEDPATELPGTPVARTGSDCFVGCRLRRTRRRAVRSTPSRARATASPISAVTKTIRLPCGVELRVCA